MRLLEKAHPSSERIADLIGMQTFKGGSWHTPGYTALGNRAFVVTPDYYTPPKKLANQLIRMSDLQFEKLFKDASS